jgi:hypothetical protein
MERTGQTVCFVLPTTTFLKRKKKMSLVATIQCEMTELDILCDATERLNMARPENGSHKLFGQKADGYAVKFNTLSYPFVFCTDSSGKLDGNIKYDTDGGERITECLNRLKQAYAVCKTRKTLLGTGSCTHIQEQTGANGSIELLCSMA